MKNCLPLLRLVCGLFFLLNVAFSLHAQQSAKDLAPVSDTYVLIGVTVVHAPDRTTEEVSVLISDGLIKNIGKDLKIPGEAQVIKADSMYVYAGFISGLSNAGIPQEKKESGERPQVDNPATPPNDLAGIQPEREVRNLLNAEEKSIEAYREAGFTAAHIVPRGLMLPGSGAVILLTGDSPDEMMVKENTAMFSQLSGGPRVYPSTVIGVMAKWRELYRQSELALQHEKAYDLQPAGTRRPAYDRTIRAFYPVLEKQKPVIFKTEEMLAAYRVMTLQKDLGFNLILAEVKQGWDLTDKIKANNIPVFLSLDLPEEKKKKEEKTDKPVSRGDDQKNGSNGDEEKAALEKRQEEAISRYCSQAADYEKAGVSFGFSTLETKPKDALKQVKVMIKHGLSEKAALAALTTYPAEVWGLSSVMGTVDPGKMANLVVSDQPVFQEKASIKYMFVDGKLFTINAKSKISKPADAEAAAKIAGTWNYVTQTPQGDRPGVLTITNEKGEMAGTVTVRGPEGGTRELNFIGLEGDKLSFSFSFSMGDQTMEIEAEVTVSGDSFEGTMSVGEFGSFPVEGEKTSDPE